MAITTSNSMRVKPRDLRFKRIMGRTFIKRVGKMTTSKENTRRDRGGRIENHNGSTRGETRQCELSQKHRTSECQSLRRQSNEIMLHLQEWLQESFSLRCATTTQGNRKTTRMQRSRVADFGSRSRRAEDGRGHKAGSSFRFGDFDCPRMGCRVSK